VFNINKKIAREKLRRQSALERLKHDCNALVDTAVEPANAFEDAIRKRPFGAVAISLGAGLAVSSLVSSRTVAAPAQPQEVIVDLRNGTTETQKAATHPGILELIMQGLSLMGMLKPPVSPPSAAPSEAAQSNGNGDGIHSTSEVL
jgi:hypothetical protein